jgi:hypothetical protein
MPEMETGSRSVVCRPDFMLIQPRKAPWLAPVPLKKRPGFRHKRRPKPDTPDSSKSARPRGKSR